MRLAILDDYQNAALRMADWASAPEIDHSCSSVPSQRTAALPALSG